MMRPYATFWAAACIMLLTATAPAQTQNALDFDGINDQVTVANASALLAGASGYSLTCWVKPTAGTEHHGIVGFRDEAVADLYLLKLQNSNSLEARFRNSGGAFFTLTYPGLVLDAWQHLALVYDGAELILYYNGNPVTSVPASGDITSTTGSFRMGNLVYSTDNFNFDGQLDEVSLWNTALTPQQVDCIVSSAVDVSTPGLQLYYRMDEGVAGGNNTAITTILDETATANGTLQGFALTGPTSNFVEGAVWGTTVQAFLCEGESYTFNGEALTEPGVYTAIFPTGGACDSTVVLQLAAAEVDNGVVQSGSTLISTAVGATWQWMDCTDPDNMTPIANATGQYYQATEVGSYAVMVTQNGCSAMSACYTVTTIGIQELEQFHFTLSPVPVKEVLYVDLSAPVRFAGVSVLDMTGREVIRPATGNGRRFAVDVSSLGRGAYFMRITTDGVTSVARFVRE